MNQTRKAAAVDRLAAGFRVFESGGRPQVKWNDLANDVLDAVTDLNEEGLQQEGLERSCRSLQERVEQGIRREDLLHQKLDLVRHGLKNLTPETPESAADWHQVSWLAYLQAVLCDDFPPEDLQEQWDALAE